MLPRSPPRRTRFWRGREMRFVSGLVGEPQAESRKEHATCTGFRGVAQDSRGPREQISAAFHHEHDQPRDEGEAHGEGESFPVSRSLRPTHGPK